MIVITSERARDEARGTLVRLVSSEFLPEKWFKEQAEIIDVGENR